MTLSRLTAVLIFSAVACTAQTPLHLIPIPRELQPGATQPIPRGVKITCTTCFTDSSDNFTAEDLTQALAERHIPTNGPFTITLTRAASSSLPPEAQAEGYTISSGTNSITLSAPT